MAGDGFDRRHLAGRAWRLLPLVELEQAPVVQRQPWSCARPRSLTLCSLEPVKYISAAPKRSAGTMRRSTCSPPAVMTLALACPEPRIFCTSGNFANASADFGAAGVVLQRADQVDVADRLAPSP